MRGACPRLARRIPALKLPRELGEGWGGEVFFFFFLTRSLGGTLELCEQNSGNCSPTINGSVLGIHNSIHSTNRSGLSLILARPDSIKEFPLKFHEFETDKKS